jgi:hypothetical protein
MDNLKTYLPPLGRLLMSSLFIWDGIRQLRSPSVFAQYFASIHVPLPNVAIWISARQPFPRGVACVALRRIDATVRQVVPAVTASFVLKELQLFDISGQDGVYSACRILGLSRVSHAEWRANAPQHVPPGDM